MAKHGKDHENPFDVLNTIFEALAKDGYSGDDLLEKAMGEWGKTNLEIGLHDMFNVSDEEEASWYDVTSKKVRTFDDLLNIFSVERGLDATKGYVRKGLREQQAQSRTFFLDWIGKVQELITGVQFGDEAILGDSILITFTTACFFAAETHDTAFFYPILDCMKWLHVNASDDDDVEYTPLSDFVYQSLSSVLYATCDDDFQRIMTYLLDEGMDAELQNELCKVLAQLSLDGVFSAAEEQQMIDQYFHFLREYGGNGDALAQWIVLSGKTATLRKKLKTLLEEHINPMFYGTTNTKEFEKMIKNPVSPLCQKGLVMDDMILFGMYPKAIHAPKDVREKAIRMQDDRIKKMKH